MRKKMRFSIVLVLVTGLIGPVFAQVGKIIDSLNDQSNRLRNIQNGASVDYARKALELSRKNGLKEKELTSLVNLCVSCNLAGDYRGSIEFCSEAIKVPQFNKNTALRSDAYLWHGLSCAIMGYNSDAITSYLKFLDLPEVLERNERMADGLSGAGLAYLNSGNFHKAKEYYRVCLEVHKKIDNPVGKAYAYQNMGRVFSGLQQYDSAQYYFDKAIATGDDPDFENVKYWAFSLMTQLPGYNEEEKLRILKDALAIALSLDLKNEIAATSYTITSMLINEGKLDSAITLGKQAIAYGLKVKNFDLALKTYNALSRSMIDAGREKESRFFLARYEALKDSIANISPGYSEGTLAGYDLLIEEREIGQIKDRLTASQAVNRQNKIVLAGVFVFAFLIGIILFMTIRANRMKTKTNQELRILNEKLDVAMKEKDALTGMMVHDIRSPFNKIEMLIDVLEMEHDLADSQKKIIKSMKSVIEDSRVLTNDLLEIIQIEVGKLEKKNEKIDIKKFIQELLLGFDNLARKKGITLMNKLTLANETMISHKYVLQRIIENLVSNAIKYTPLQGQVELNTKLEKGQFEFSVKDNGPGISESEQKLLFKKFGRASAIPSGDETSTGLGLYIVDIMTKNLNGRVYLTSAEGMGAEFRVQIPIESLN